MEHPAKSSKSKALFSKKRLGTAIIISVLAGFISGVFVISSQMTSCTKVLANGGYLPSPEEGTEAYSDSPSLQQAQEEHLKWVLAYRKAAFQAHLVESRIIFATVLLMVCFGLYLSYIQFKQSNQSEGSIKLGTGGIEVTSSVLGVLILFFSIGFFYLYLVHVFPMREIGQEALPAKTQ